MFKTPIYTFGSSLTSLFLSVTRSGGLTLRLHPLRYEYFPLLWFQACALSWQSRVCVFLITLLMFDLDRTFGPEFCGCLFVDSVASSLLCMGSICIFIVTVAREIFNSGCIIAPERKADHSLRVQFSEKCGISFQCLVVLETGLFLYFDEDMFYCDLLSL